MFTVRTNDVKDPWRIIIWPDENFNVELFWQNVNSY